MIQRISCTINHNLPNYVKNYLKKTFLAQTVRIQLVTPETARLSIFFTVKSECWTSARYLNLGRTTDRKGGDKKKPG